MVGETIGRGYTNVEDHVKAIDDMMTGLDVSQKNLVTVAKDDAVSLSLKRAIYRYIFPTISYIYLDIYFPTYIFQRYRYIFPQRSYPFLG